MTQSEWRECKREKYGLKVHLNSSVKEREIILQLCTPTLAALAKFLISPSSYSSRYTREIVKALKYDDIFIRIYTRVDASGLKRTFCSC